jgi:hypothetical protein
MGDVDTIGRNMRCPGSLDREINLVGDHSFLPARAEDRCIEHAVRRFAEPERASSQKKKASTKLAFHRLDGDES